MTALDDTALAAAQKVPGNVSGSDAVPAISVVLCTHNRAGYLTTAIRSILEQASATPWELILVDNRSTDDTGRIGRDLAARGLLRYVEETQLGLCYARNTGWRSARGDIVAYFDDDAIAEPGWIDAIADAFAHTPQPGVVGGRVDPIWEAERPAWLSDGISLSLTIVDWSEAPKYIPDVRVEWLVGANMAVPRRILEEIGGFDVRLDRIGTNMLSGGDVYLQKEILARGYPCLYHPGMAIRHLAAKSRLNQPWFERRYYWQGISDAVMTLIAENPSRLGRLRRALSSAAQLAARPADIARLLRRSQDPAEFEERCWALIRVGYIAGLLGKARV